MFHSTSAPVDGSIPTATDGRGAAREAARRAEGGSGGEAALDTLANKSSPERPVDGFQIRFDKRKRRFDARYWLWKFTTLRRLAYCGRFPTLASGGVGVRHRDGVAGFAGLQTCGSVWCCPVCNAKIMARRGLELGAAVETWASGKGRSVAFMTFTVRHTKRDTLEQVWAAISKSWGRVTSGKHWISDQLEHGIEGFVRVIEVTHGRNGWHVHVHSLMFLHDLVTSDVVKLQRSMFKRWKAGAESLGLRAPLMRGQDVRVVSDSADGRHELSKYLSKSQLAMAVGRELTASQGKKARSKLSTRTTWAILDDAVDGLADAVDLWAEWERGSKGKRQISWSVGLRERLGLMEEKSDGEVAAEEFGSADDTVAIIWGWDDLAGRRLMAECLRAVEKDGNTGLAKWLTEHEIEHEMVRVN